MKILFLDIDGVLNGKFSNCEIQKIGDDIVYSDDFISMIDKKAVMILNRIIKQTKAKIVISSSWRYSRTPKEIQKILVYHGFIGEVIDRTPMGSEINAKTAGAPSPKFSERYDRGWEIKQWLNEHSNIDNFAVVDDDWTMEAVKNHFIKTNGNIGLQESDADELINILNSKNGNTI